MKTPATTHAIHWLIDRQHIATSDLDICRYIYGRLTPSARAYYRKQPRKYKRAFISAILTRHRANRDLYYDVMAGRI